VDLFSSVLTLFLIMDPLGNVPLFLAVLRVVPPERRRRVLMREIGFAYVVLLAFLFAGRYLMQFLHLEEATIGIAGGIVLFLISLRMIFPTEQGVMGETMEGGEPFVVPLAIPLFAGPSTLAALLLLEQAGSAATGSLFLAVTIAWAVSGAILLSSTFFYRVLRERGLIAMERLMGMILVMVAVQMATDGIRLLMASTTVPVAVP
jgi:multiple antibiotic resistance protein